MPTYCLTCKSNKIQEIVEGNQVLYSCAACNKKSGRALIIDGKIRIIRTSRGIKHIAVAAILIKDERLLLVQRRTYPYGLELPAGHVEHNETLEDALRREVYEEVGVKISSATPLAQIEHPTSYCRYGSDIEEWSIFLVESEKKDDQVSNYEIDAITWAPIDSLPIDAMTPPTQYVLEQLGYLPLSTKAS